MRYSSLEQKKKGVPGQVSCTVVKASFGLQIHSIRVLACESQVSPLAVHILSNVWPWRQQMIAQVHGSQSHMWKTWIEF